jgi:hypothetical protein
VRSRAAHRSACEPGAGYREAAVEQSDSLPWSKAAACERGVAGEAEWDWWTSRLPEALGV